MIHAMMRISDSLDRSSPVSTDGPFCYIFWPVKPGKHKLGHGFVCKKSIFFPIHWIIDYVVCDVFITM